MAERPDPPPPGFRWDWREFVFATLSNAAGTLLALFIGYLGGVATGYFQFNGWLIALFVASFGVSFVLLRPRKARTPPPEGE